MSELAIRAEEISKRYRIGSRDEDNDTLTGAALSALSQPLKNLKRLSRLSTFREGDGEEDVIWAVRDVSFDVSVGEVVGVIGGNGAGKSTLLKLLTRITKPTSGQATIRGHVSSLLEVGTGFHPELTGRENVYLNGAVLGMKGKEIREKFDAIVDFSGVERFIDTPVKRYSTGMKVRLAFSVAAHLDPDVLLVDEVLSVGDTAFQRKCLGKMDEVAHRGRTVLFVSHNLAAVTRLCDRILLLENGRLVMDGPSDKVMGRYLQSDAAGMARHEWPDPATAPGGEYARLRAMWATNSNGRISDTMDIREPVRLEMEFEALRAGTVLYPQFVLWNAEADVAAFTTMDTDPEWWERPRPAGRYRVSATVPGNLLSEGLYRIVARIKSQATSKEFSEDAASFLVMDPADGTTVRGPWKGSLPGVLRPRVEWSTEYSPIHEESTTTLVR